MRNISKALVVAVGLLSIGVSSQTARANSDHEVAAFTLSHPTQWNSVKLSPGYYTLSLAPGSSSAKVLEIHGAHQALQILVFPQSACGKCQLGNVNLAVQGDKRVVTSVDLHGYHLDFRSSWSPAEREQMSKAL